MESSNPKLGAAPAYTYSIVTGKIVIAPAFVPIALDDTAQKASSSLTFFFGTNGLSAETIVKNTTTCQTRIFEIMTTYVPRAMYKVTALTTLLAMQPNDIVTALAINTNALFAGVDPADVPG